MDGNPFDSHIITIAQIGLDVLLFALIMVLIARRPRGVKGGDELVHTLERIVTDTRTLSDEFERNLRERREVIQHILDGLDRRLDEAKEIHDRLAALQLSKRESGKDRTPPPGNTGDHRLVVTLAQKGLSAQAIAKKLRKPIGEVELILNLQRLSSKS
ncbi:MAG: hypothetical protein SWC40_12015 [Thermodesulfobacteriota bacterium]|nr:hypothetical protein [Thermodesulfobacteriota bacterium]